MTGFFAPAMDRTQIKALLMDGLVGDDGTFFSTIADNIVEGMFAERGFPQTITEPVVRHLVRQALMDGRG